MVIKKIFKRVAILSFILLILNFRIFKVQGDSMYPTLSEGDWVLTTNLFQHNNLDGKIVVAYTDILDLNTYIIKRVNYIKNGKFYLISDNNGNHLDSGVLGGLDSKSIKYKVICVLKWQ